MRKAIAAASIGISSGQTPFGACIAKGKREISSTHNGVWEKTDITAHAEILAIRKACAIIDTTDLSGCVIYSTTEPCPMCFAACHWARIKRIVFGSSIDDAARAGFNELRITNEVMRKYGECSVEIVCGILKDDCMKLFKDWRIREDKRPY